MSIRFLFIAIILISGSILRVDDLKAQCNPGELAENCISQLDTNFHFLKSYELDGLNGEKEMIEHSYVLTRSTDYLINLCSDAETEMDVAIEIFDSNRKSVASSKTDSLLNSSLEFDCRVTGIYYLQYTFIDSQSHCGASAIGFKSD
ncbi:MAG: hypothetical protein RLN79_11790 [Cytophagales bacterium]